MCLHPGAMRARLGDDSLFRPQVDNGPIFLCFCANSAGCGGLLVTPALAQRPLPPPGVYEERLPPVMGRYDDDDLYPATPVTPRNGRRGSNRALPYPDDEPAQPPPPGLFESSRGHQLDTRQQPQIDPRQPPAATQ